MGLLRASISDEMRGNILFDVVVAVEYSTDDHHTARTPIRDVRFREMWYDNARGTWCMKLEHPDFPQSIPGALLQEGVLIIQDPFTYVQEQADINAAIPTGAHIENGEVTFHRPRTQEGREVEAFRDNIARAEGILTGANRNARVYPAEVFERTVDQQLDEVMTEMHTPEEEMPTMENMIETIQTIGGPPVHRAVQRPVARGPRAEVIELDAHDMDNDRVTVDVENGGLRINGGRRQIEEEMRRELEGTHHAADMTPDEEHAFRVRNRELGDVDERVRLENRRRRITFQAEAGHGAPESPDEDVLVHGTL